MWRNRQTQLDTVELAHEDSSKRYVGFLPYSLRIFPSCCRYWWQLGRFVSDSSIAHNYPETKRCAGDRYRRIPRIKRNFYSDYTCPFFTNDIRCQRLKNMR